MVTAGPSTAQRVGSWWALLLLPLAAIVLASAALLRAGGWTGALLVLAGALLLTLGIGLVSAPARAEHVARRTNRP